MEFINAKTIMSGYFESSQLSFFLGEQVRKMFSKNSLHIKKKQFKKLLANIYENRCKFKEEIVN
ncbi:hypothetical protein [Clostridium saccharoperbutylacetonicum]|uniref:hypothetical protein n=1 Tax=Clostridium saccharoperbutylacetonicum TaxID=36745 RepID=UPI0009839168|nr:hypothetical protein [Clostridium saccharoperbutylacetonicum]AQR97891.1 hypothetical protein CLSAP_52240 [Clostridium saccharoperbutylacetonicum]NSB33783.1 hypothetical protein [Clostridium saccharoperbutylacetonicum]